MGKLYEKIAEAINSSSDMTEEQKQEVLRIILKNSEKKSNILITGATGCGKSSTINALFKMEKAKVGTGVDPETMEIARYDLDSLTLWDSPGLGDGAEADKRHATGIAKKLNEKDNDGNLLIDIVLVILDGSSRDLGTSYELINKVIAPNLGDRNNRLLIGINQADMAMKGKHWNSETHKPDEELLAFLKKKERSVSDRIKEGTGISVQPVSYSAGFKEEGMPQEPAYNLSKLMYYIMDSIPAEKRIAVVQEMNDDTEMWASDDGEYDYREGIKGSFVGGLKNASLGAASGAALGAAIGSVIPGIGTAIGAAVGTIVGAIGGFFSSIFGF